jgi:hypothetical protein
MFVKWVIVSLILCVAGPGYAQISMSPSVVLKLDPEPSKDQLTRNLTIQVGDSIKAQFDPSFTATMWEGECSFKVDLSTIAHPMDAAVRSTSTFNSQTKTTLTTNTMNHEMFIRDDGNFEWTIILKDKPDTNLLVYSIEMEGLDFCYQPALPVGDTMLWEIAVGDEWFGDSLIAQEGDTTGYEHRPDSVVESYAIYHNSKMDNVRKVDGSYEIYETGKAGHIYRIKMWDAIGDTVWAEDQHINTETGTWTIILDAKWLATATPPITIDPYLGNDADGASGWSLANRARCWARTMGGTAGTLDSLGGYWLNDGGAGIYTDDGTDADSLLDTATTDFDGGASRSRQIGPSAEQETVSCFT